MKIVYVLVNLKLDMYFHDTIDGINWVNGIEYAQYFERESLAEYTITQLPNGIYEIKPIYIKN